MIRQSWGRAVARARQLAATTGPTAELLATYAELLAAQSELYESLRTRDGWTPSGSLDRDLAVLRSYIPSLLRGIADRGPRPLSLEAGRLLEADGQAALAERLLDCWRTPSDREFFAKAILQPYACYLVDRGAAPCDRASLTGPENRCPFCGGAPQLAILHGTAGAEGGGRLLLCATCLTTWAFRRVMCACCGEEDERKLGYFRTPEFDHLRVDACEACRRYLKTVDLTRLGVAVPIVDEVAGAPLDLWARDHGYEKIELNLLGL